MIKLNHHLYLIYRSLQNLVASQMCAVRLDTTRSTTISSIWASGLLINISLYFLQAYIWQ